MSFLSFASKTIRPAAGPSAAPSSTRVSPFFPPPSAPSPPVWAEASPRVAAIRSSARSTLSSKLRPLRVPASSASASASRPWSSPESSAVFASRLVELRLELLVALVLALLALLRPLADRRQDRAQRVVLVLGGEPAHELLVALLEHPLDLGLDRPLAVLAEGGGDLLGQPVAVGVERLAERAGGLVVAEHAAQALLDPLDGLLVLLLDRLAVGVRDLLELAPHVVDLDRRVLAVEHPGADLDRAANRADRAPRPPADALADDPRGRLVGDLQVLDDDPVVDQAHGPLGGVDVERQLWLLRGFHRTHEGSRAPGRDLTRCRFITMPRLHRHAHTTLEGTEPWP